MAKKFNPVAYVVSSARKAWLWSSIRKQALVAAGYQCEECGSMESIQVHHREQVDLYKKVKKVMDELIPPNADNLDVLCKSCHDSAHRKDT